MWLWFLPSFALVDFRTCVAVNEDGHGDAINEDGEFYRYNYTGFLYNQKQCIQTGYTLKKNDKEKCGVMGGSVNIMNYQVRIV